MKVNYLILSFAAAAMLASCSSEFDPTADVDGKSVVSFTAQLPASLGRSYGDGFTATRLQYAVFDEAGNALPKLSGETEFQSNSLKTTVDIQLLNSKKYKVAFWASAPGAPYEFDATAGTVTAKYTDATTSNLETLDAFWGVTDLLSVDGDATVSVTMKRPLSQINIGTSDLTTVRDAGTTVAKVSVTVDNAYTKLDLLTGAAVGDPETVTFGYGAIPTGEDFPISGNEYLAMNYVMVGTEPITANVTFAIEGIDASHSFTEVPLRANYRTNLYGALLSTSSGGDVGIDPSFSE